MKVCKHCGEEFDEKSVWATRVRTERNRLINECPECVDPDNRLRPSADLPKAAPPAIPTLVMPWWVQIPVHIHRVRSSGGLAALYAELEEMLLEIGLEGVWYERENPDELPIFYVYKEGRPLLDASVGRYEPAIRGDEYVLTLHLPKKLVPYWDLKGKV